MNHSEKNVTLLDLSDIVGDVIDGVWIIVGKRGLEKDSNMEYLMVVTIITESLTWSFWTTWSIVDQIYACGYICNVILTMKFYWVLNLRLYWDLPINLIMILNMGLMKKLRCLFLLKNLKYFNMTGLINNH